MPLYGALRKDFHAARGESPRGLQFLLFGEGKGLQLICISSALPPSQLDIGHLFICPQAYQELGAHFWQQVRSLLPCMKNTGHKLVLAGTYVNSLLVVV